MKFIFLPNNTFTRYLLYLNLIVNILFRHFRFIFFICAVNNEIFFFYIWNKQWRKCSNNFLWRISFSDGGLEKIVIPVSTINLRHRGRPRKNAGGTIVVLMGQWRWWRWSFSATYKYMFMGIMNLLFKVKIESSRVIPHLQLKDLNLLLMVLIF